MLIPRITSPARPHDVLPSIAGFLAPDVLLTAVGMGLDHRLVFWRIRGGELHRERELELDPRVQTVLVTEDGDLLTIRLDPNLDGRLPSYHLECRPLNTTEPVWSLRLTSCTERILAGAHSILLPSRPLVRLRRSTGALVLGDMRSPPCAWDAHQRQWIACLDRSICWDDGTASYDAPAAIRELAVCPDRHVFALLEGAPVSLWQWEARSGWCPLDFSRRIEGLVAHPSRAAVYCLHGSQGATLVAADGTQLHRRYVVADQARALPCGDLLVCVGTHVGAVRLVDFTGPERPTGHDGEITTLGWTSRGDLLTCSTVDKRVLLTDRRTGELRSLDTPPGFELQCAARSLRETWLVGLEGALCWPDDGTAAHVPIPADEHPVKSLHVSADGRFALALRAAGRGLCVLERWAREGDGWTLHSHLVPEPMFDDEFQAIAISPRGDRWIQPPFDDPAEPDGDDEAYDDEDEDDEADDDHDYGEELEIRSETETVRILVGERPCAAQLGHDLALVASPRRIMLFDPVTGRPRAARPTDGVNHAILAPRGLVVALREREVDQSCHLDFLRGSDLELVHTHRLPLAEAFLLAIGGPNDWLAVGGLRGERHALEVDWDALARLSPVSSPTSG